MHTCDDNSLHFGNDERGWEVKERQMEAMAAADDEHKEAEAGATEEAPVLAIGDLEKLPESEEVWVDDAKLS